MSRLINFRASEILYTELVAFADAWQQTVSHVLRDAVVDLLQHPERYPDLIAQRLPPAPVDERTPEQIAAWARDRERLTRFDPREVLETLPHGPE